MNKVELRLEISYEWSTVESLDGTAYRFPGPVLPRMSALYKNASIYRWVFYSKDGQLASVYFGETDNLARRIGQYLAPGKTQQTNIRLNKHLIEHSEQGLIAGMEMLKLGSFKINGIDLASNCLDGGSVRKLIESLLIVEFQGNATNSECKVLNRPAGISGERKTELLRRVRSALKSATPAEREDILRKARA